MTNICFITYQFKTGGVEKLFTTLSDELKDNVYLLTVTSGNDEIVGKIPKNVKLIQHPTFLKYIQNRHLQYILFILFFIVKVNIDITYRKMVFINFSDTLSTLFATWFISIGRLKKYSWIQMSPKVIHQSKFYKIYAFLYSKMTNVICICSTQRKAFLNLFPQIETEKIVVVNNCINTNEINQLKLVPLNSEFQYEKYILMVARLDTRSKDFYTLIDAYDDNRIKNEYKLFFLGDGPDKQLISDYIESKDLSQNVILLGQDLNPYKWMYNAFLYIHSSKAEGFGLVLIEAMQCSVPVIATDCEVGPKEILDKGKYGTLVPVGDVKALRNAILTFVVDPNKRLYYKEKGSERARYYSVNKSIDIIKNNLCI